MKRYGILILILVIVTASMSGPYDANWNHHKRFYLNTTSLGADIQGNQKDFPVLLRLTDQNISELFSDYTGDGNDFRFSWKNGLDELELPFEIEKIVNTETEKEILVWVRVPWIYGNNGSQYITMHWGNSIPPNDGLCDGSKVFNGSNGYAGVWHLDGLAGASNDQFLSATGTNDGTAANLTSADERDGIVGKGQYLNGTNSHVDCGTITPDISGNVPRTIEGWVQGNEGTNFVSAFGFTTTSTNNNKEFFDFEINSNTRYWMFTGNGNGYGTGVATNNGTWHHLAASYDGQNIYVFVDGALHSTNSITDLVTHNNFRIGWRQQSGEHFKGTFDEIRCSNVSRSTDWMKLCYENQKSNQTLVATQPVAILTLRSDGRGSVSITDNSPTMDFGTVSAPIQAVPLSGYAFDGWSIFGADGIVTLSDDVKSPTNNVELNGTSAIVMANFRLVDPSAVPAYPSFAGAGDDLQVDGSVTVGNNPEYEDNMLEVNGFAKCNGMRIKKWLFRQKTTPADYVFEKGYDLKGLDDVEAYIKKNGHLPDVPSADSIKTNGLELTEFNMLMLRKIEELTLYQIESQKTIARQQKVIEKLQSKMVDFEKQ